MLAELSAFTHIAPRGIVGPLRGPHRAAGDVDAPSIQPLHRESEALAFLAEAIFGRNFNLIKGDGPRGLTVPAHFVFLAAVLNAGGVRKRVVSGKRGYGRVYQSGCRSNK